MDSGKFLIIYRLYIAWRMISITCSWVAFRGFVAAVASFIAFSANTGIYSSLAPSSLKSLGMSISVVANGGTIHGFEGVDRSEN